MIGFFAVEFCLLTEGIKFYGLLQIYLLNNVEISNFYVWISFPGFISIRSIRQWFPP